MSVVRLVVGVFARVAFVAILALSCTLSCATPGDVVARAGLDRIRAAGVLRWGGDLQGGEPYVYDDPAHPGRLVGFEVELAEALARELGVRAEFVQTDWANLIPSLDRRDFDVVLNGLEVTDARAGRVLFTRPYYVFTERLVARKDDPTFVGIAPDLRSLEGRRVGTLANSLAFDLLRTVTDPVVYDGVEEPYRDLETGRVDAVLLDDIIVHRDADPKPGLRVVGDVAEGRYAIGVRLAERDVKEALDGALGRILASGELRLILEAHRLWNVRQERLGTWTGDAARTEAARPARFGSEHVLLFAKAALVTLLVSTLAMILAVGLGLGLALVRMFGRPLYAKLAGAYVEIYRGTPVLLQLYVLYFGLAHVVRLGAFPAAVIGLGMNYAAYEAEAYRAGIQAVPKAQMESALALGMSLPVALRRIILPQALRHAIPNVTNDFIALLKDSSLVSAITVVELTKRMTITAVDVRSWLAPGLVCAAFYLAMSYPLGIAARRLERKLEGERE